MRQLLASPRAHVYLDFNGRVADWAEDSEARQFRWAGLGLAMRRGQPGSAAPRLRLSSCPATLFARS